MLGIACLIIGVSSYWVLSNSLMNRAYEQLEETAHRAVIFKPRDHEAAADLTAASSGTGAPCSTPPARAPAPWGSAPPTGKPSSLVCWTLWAPSRNSARPTGTPY